MAALKIIRQILVSYDKRNLDNHQEALEELLNQPFTDVLQASTLASLSPIASTPINANSSKRRTSPSSGSGESGFISRDVRIGPDVSTADSAGDDDGKYTSTSAHCQ